jgi:hypothetical protein
MRLRHHARRPSRFQPVSGMCKEKRTADDDAFLSCISRKFWGTELSRTVRLHIEISVKRNDKGDQDGLTFVLRAVRPAAFSLVCLPLCGPGFGISPFAKASNILVVVSAVKSSCIRPV